MWLILDAFFDGLLICFQLFLGYILIFWIAVRLDLDYILIGFIVLSIGFFAGFDFMHFVWRRLSSVIAVLLIDFRLGLS